MAKQLQFLIFDLLDADDLSHTWQAMASTAPVRLPAVMKEVSEVAAWLQSRTGGQPQTLDEGGDWDMWLDVQADGYTPHHLTWTEAMRPTELAFPTDTQWVTVTLTLAVGTQWAEGFQHHLDTLSPT